MSESTPGQKIRIASGGLQINVINSELEDTVGAALLGMIALILVFALIRSQRQNRKLLQRLQSPTS
ncbi:MAG: hypothetical protein HY866_06040 [Chloroflexi bacterium]|nr:hypothetical protein [Chloroflexota bacterium]